VTIMNPGNRLNNYEKITLPDINEGLCSIFRLHITWMKVLLKEMSTKCKSLKEKVPEIHNGMLELEAIQGEVIP